MEFLKKKLYSENPLKRCILTKVQPLHTAASAPATSVKSNSADPDSSDLGIFVPHPPPEVRLVIFKELGDCDRLKLFDSKSFKRNNSHASEKYTYVRSPTDRNDLSEMLFGSVGTAQKAASLKIHSIKSPPSLMLSWVLLQECATASLDRAFESSFEIQCSNSIFSRRKANTMPVPFPASTPGSTASSCSSQSGTFHRCDSGISSSSGSFQLNLPSPGHINTHGSTVYYVAPGFPHTRAHSLPKNKRDSFTSSDEQTPNEKLLRRNRIKIGFAMIFEPEPSDYENFRLFFFEHFPIIENRATVLKDRIETILKTKPKSNLNDVIMKALDQFSSRFVMLYTAPRLPEPVWSTLRSPQLTAGHRRIVVDSFVADLTRLVTDHNTKQKNFFVSALLTAVLTHHLSWVTTATPAQVKNGDFEENDHNALWAQLGDLYGAVGSPTKICRTVVTGSCHEVVSTLLAVLSYFIRSSRVDDVVKVPSSLTPVSLGIKDSPPFRAVTEHLVPCDIDNSEYVCYSLELEDQDQVEEKDEKINRSQKSCSKNVISRSKSSPHKVRNIEVEDEEASPLTRSLSGPTMTKLYRPRSNAIIDTPVTIRHRTFSNKILTQQKSVQSRRRSHDPPAPSVPPAKCRNCTGSSSTTTKSSSTMNVCGSFCMKREVTWSEQAADSPVFPPADAGQPPEEEGLDRCSLMPSFVDSIQPQIERLVNVQRASVDSTREVRPQKQFAKKDDLKTRPNYLPVVECHNCVNEEAVTDFKKHHRSRTLQFHSVKTKLGTRRQQLPFLSDEADLNEKQASFQAANHHKFQLMRIPSVEFNHNQFEECFGSHWPDLFDVDRNTPSRDENSEEEPHLPSSVVDSTTFSGLRQQLNAVGNNASPAISSIYPKLPSERGDNPIANASNSVARSGIYPPLPSNSGFDSVSFVSLSEQVSFNRKTEAPIPDHNPPRPPALDPSHSRLNSVQSSRTVTMTEELVGENPLVELPMAGIEFDEPGRPRDDMKTGRPPSGFATIVADFYPDYMSDFILHGTFNHPDLHRKILTDLEETIKNPALDEPVSESICIVADTDNWTVKVYSSHRLHSDRPSLPALNSKLVSNGLHRFANMSKMGLSADFCMGHLENELNQLVLKSRVLAEYTRGRTRVKMGQLSAALSIESQDLPLLMSIASCHSPHVARMML